jgi:hypothetical protein
MDESGLVLNTSDITKEVLPWITPQLKVLDMTDDISGAPPITVGDGQDLASS